MSLMLASYNYWIVIALMMIGLYTILTQDNLIKKVVGLSIMQVSVFIMYISVAKVSGGAAPILSADIQVYSNPLPHVLILTAIVVGVSTMALALALAIRIKNAYGTVEETEIRQREQHRC